MKQNKYGNIRSLLLAIKPYTGEMTLAILSSLLKQSCIIGAAGITSYMAGLALNKTLPGDAGTYVIILTVCILGRAAFQYGEMLFAHDVAFRAIRNYRLALYDQIRKISPACTIKNKTGQLGQTLVGDVEVLELFLAHTFSGFVVAAIMEAVIACVLGNISLILMAAMLVTSVLLVMIPYLLKKKAKKQGDEVRDGLAEANSLMVEGIQGIREITMLHYEASYIGQLEEKLNRLNQAQKKYGERKGTEGMLTHLLSGGFIIFVLVVSAALVVNGEMDTAMYPVAVMLSTVILSPVMELAAVAQDMGLVIASADRIQGILHTAPAVKDTGVQTCDTDIRNIRFENVSYVYADGNEVLHGVHLELEPEKVTVLVGHSGAGKSTCANLLLRYYDVNNGQITINNTDIRDYTMESLRKNISAVPQETYLFHESIRENIRIGRPDATDEDVIKAAKAARAHEFIRHLPDGYDTITGEQGFRLSGGERQRISIARAILRNTPVILFDEAVSNLDTDNEKYIQEMLRSRLQGKTVLMIAHRLSTILSADKVVVLDHGKVLDSGTHEELMGRCEIYRHLVEQQCEL